MPCIQHQQFIVESRIINSSQQPHLSSRTSPSPPNVHDMPPERNQPSSQCKECLALASVLTTMLLPLLCYTVLSWFRPQQDNTVMKETIYSK